jgi:hypothetical protein
VWAEREDGARVVPLISARDPYNFLNAACCGVREKKGLDKFVREGRDFRGNRRWDAAGAIVLKYALANVGGALTAGPVLTGSAAEPSPATACGQ